MRWTEIGAEAMLELRPAKVYGVWTEFWDYYIDSKKMNYTKIKTQA